MSWYDEELPAGFQDVDLEQAEFERESREAEFERESREYSRTMRRPARKGGRDMHAMHVRPGDRVRVTLPDEEPRWLTVLDRDFIDRKVIELVFADEDGVLERCYRPLTILETLRPETVEELTT
jgi:hypothetical protein